MSDIFVLPKLIQPSQEDLLKNAIDFLHRNSREPKKVRTFLEISLFLKNRQIMVQDHVHL